MNMVAADGLALPPSGNEAQIMLGVLTEVERNSTATQRQIAGNLGIALGLANACLKRCVMKGLIKVRQAPANRYLYYLTPAGFSEKAHLTAEYLTQSFHFYRSARRDCADALEEGIGRGWSRIAIAGASELAEVMVLCGNAVGMVPIGVIDPAAAGTCVAGLPVVADIAALGVVDGVAVAALHNAQAVYDGMAAQLGPDRLVAPALLRLRLSTPSAEA